MPKLSSVNCFKSMLNKHKLKLLHNINLILPEDEHIIQFARPFTFSHVF